MFIIRLADKKNRRKTKLLPVYMYIYKLWKWKYVYSPIKGPQMGIFIKKQ